MSGKSPCRGLEIHSSRKECRAFSVQVRLITSERLVIRSEFWVYSRYAGNWSALHPEVLTKETATQKVPGSVAKKNTNENLITFYEGASPAESRTHRPECRRTTCPESMGAAARRVVMLKDGGRSSDWSHRDA